MSVSVDLIRVVAKALGELNEQAVFVGGATVPFYLPESLRNKVRPTEDIDVVIEMIPKKRRDEFEAILRAKGFQNDVSQGAPICRWILGSVKVDIMSPNEDLLGFTNCWYKDGVRHTFNVEFSDVSVKLMTLPFFLATKIEAFKGRGKGDISGSSDMEDTITVIDVLEDSELKEVFTLSPKNVRSYLREEFRAFVQDEGFVQAIAGIVSDRNRANERAQELAEEIKKFL